MQSSLCNQAEWPLPEKYNDTEDEVNDLEEGKRFHGAIEVFGEEVPEYLRPEEAFYRSGYLVYELCQ
jgi:hypothetical protein